jgi:penicillin-binding protein 1A
VVLELVLAGQLSLSAPELPKLPPITREPQVTYLDRNGAVIGVRGGKHAPPVDVTKLPRHVPMAFVAIEDRRFYEHTGVDPRGIARALVKDLQKGRLAEGGSTITQQLARNLFPIGFDQTAERKAKELAYAVQLERTYTKYQILGLYLSRVNFGEGAYGLEAAARRYFNKAPAKLSIREAAMLAAIMKSPTNYSPVDNPQENAERTRLVLAAMAEAGVITEAQRQTALKQTPKVAKTSPTDAAQYFIDWIDGEVLRVTGKPRQDVIVETTLDLALERAAQDAAKTTVGKHAPQAQAAVVAIDGAGRVRALVGGTSHVSAPYNRAVDARRQAGSAWKPFVYLTALEQGRTPDMPVVDEPITIANWSPKNYDEGFLGPITLEQAVARSVNTVAARVADEVGRQNVAAVARRLGIVSTVNTDPAMALGTTLVSPLEMTQAYATFSNGGNRVQAYGIERIRSGGKVLFQKKPHVWQPVIANPALSDLNRMLRSVIKTGTGTRAAIPGYDLAGKTGTTSDYKDAWFCGYTGGFASCTWIGRDDAKPVGRMTGGAAPAEMWRTFMTTALKRVPVVPIPAGPAAPPPPPPQEPSVVPASNQTASAPAR